MNLETPDLLAYIALFAPFIACVVITLGTLKHKALSGWIAVLGIGAVLAATAMLGPDAFGDSAYVRVHDWSWINVGGFDMRFGVQVDALSVLMSLIVGIVGLAVFVYSTGYMHGEDGYSRYFACISLFAFSMQGIVFSPSLVQTFVFWELVGVSSYSLIGYYFHKPSAVDAGKKAFLTNRIGDFGMTCGILLLFFTVAEVMGPCVQSSFSFVELRALYESGALDTRSTALSLAALLIFTGAVAKSAQVPLHVWLPDAMEGPTPVSALMHAATMVAAGVFLVARCYFMFAPYEGALTVVAWMGGITALLAALLAFVQYDIKKVLAYSTLSQLGYMVMALGLFGPAAAMFHLMTHAFFKSLLFLGAGSVIHGCHHEQDMRQMGGLQKKMPITAWTFYAGTLALAGIVPFAGFWSKDAVLATAAHPENGSLPLYGIGLLVALMTAAYMGRCCLMTFRGEYRGHAEPHESPPSMTFPLMGLAILAVGSGFLNFPGHQIDHLLIGEGGASWFKGAKVDDHFHWSVAIGGTIAALLGIAISWVFYGSRQWSIDAFVAKVKPLHTLLENKYYFDDLYDWIVQNVQQRIADGCSLVENNLLVKGLVNNFAALHLWFGAQIRLLLDGHLHRYVTVALIGVVFVISMIFARGG